LTSLTARQARGQAIGRPKVLASREAATTTTATFGVSRATIYRVLADVDTAK
jgi:hypothetical protein